MSARSSVALVLALFTGLILGQLLAPSLVVRPNSSAQERSTEDAAEMFYEAMNRYLGRGDPAVLADTLHPKFVDHSAIYLEQDAAGLIRYLSAMRATYPDMRMQVTGMTPHDDLVAISVATTGGTAANAGGLVSDRPPSAPGYEQLRIVDGKVAERWASQTLPPQYEMFASFDLNFFSGWFVECIVEPLPLAPGASETRRHFSPSMLIASSGAVALEIERNGSNESALLLSGDPASPTALRRGARFDLENQSVVMLPEGEAYRVWNPGKQPASVIIVEIRHLSPAVTFNGSQNDWSDPASESGSFMTAGLLPMGTDPDRTYKLSLARVAAAPNEMLPIHTVNGVEHLLVVEGGLDVELLDKHAAVFGPGDRSMAAPGDRPRLLPGEGITAIDDTLIAYRVTADAPAAIWIISIIRAPVSSERG
jgi:predicted SnoaL-like aldol condensation-catalyzing enzyme/quercetin dioxygenase-like cupin family protein